MLARGRAASTWRCALEAAAPGRAHRPSPCGSSGPIVVWNVVFDHVIVVAGRDYIARRARAAAPGGPFANMDEWMRPAVARGVWMATAAGAVVLVPGWIAVHLRAPLRPRSADRDSRGHR